MQLMRWSSLILAITGAGLLAAGGDDKPGKSPDGEGKLLAKPEAFKTLVNPKCSHCVDEAKRRAGELRDDDRVLAWIRGYSQGGGIPARFFLAPYRVISDTYGVFVYDPDAGFMHGFEPSLDFEFHGWRNGVMVMRHKDGTLYSCLSGRAFDGPRKGDQLKPVPTVETNWGYWLSAYPGAVAYHMFETYQPVELPKADSIDSLSSRSKPDPRLPPNTPVIGLSVGGQSRAYPISELEKMGGLIQGTSVGREKVVVLWYAPTRTAAIFAPELDAEKEKPKQPVTLKVDQTMPAAPFVDSRTGSRFDIVGRAVEGPLRGRTLRWLPGVECRWFAWAAEYPETEIHATPGKASASALSPQNSQREANAQTTGRVPGGPPLEAVIVRCEAVTNENLRAWKNDGFGAVTVVLDAQHDPASYQSAAKAIASSGLDLYYWIEVGRNPTLASAHPEWMASLGMHEDWHERFPNTPLPQKGEVAKAFPWVPIGYREAFDAHLNQVGKLLDSAAEPYRGVLLNDLQGGPASCGCGNLQCRWAIDYHVASTATKINGDDVAARFVADVQKLVGTKELVPVWTTECEEVDLPAARRPANTTTGLCGSVPCAHGTCPKAFAQQWSTLVSDRRGPIGVLATHKEFDRDRKEYGDPAGWITNAIDYLESVPAKYDGQAVPRDQLWIVVQGYDTNDSEQSAARSVAAKTGAGAVLVSLTRIDQTYEPRIVRAK